MSTVKKTVSLFWTHVKQHPWYVAGLFVNVPITVLLLDFMKPFVLAQVLERVSTGAYDPHNLAGSFGGAIVAYILLTLFSDIVGWRINTFLIWTLEIKVMRDIANRVYNHLNNMSGNFHANRFSGALVSQANKLAGAYMRFADTTMFNFMTLIWATIFTVIILAPRAPLFVAAMLGLIAVYVVGMVFMARWIQPVSVQEAQQESKQTGLLADSMTNVMAIKSFAAEEFEAKKFRSATNKTYAAVQQVMKRIMLRDLFASITTGGLGIVALLLAVFGGGVFKADIATIFLMVTYTGMLGHRLWEFNSVLRNYNRAFGDAHDMVEILAIEPEVKDPVKPQKSRITQGGIVFKDMQFTHPDAGEALFSNLNLTIKPGEKIGLVGHSGSGKTTLTRVLLRFADIDGGTITIDGQNITHITQADLRRHIAYVPQEPLLFHRSIRENISYGKPNATDAEIKQAARLAHAAEFVEKLPKGYDTLVGERGVKLSGGQRQRVAIARAMLKDAPILVLDEATSALDSESERLIQDALWQLMRGRTAIVIAHRLSTIQKMDRIVVLEEGAIVEQGSHAQLLKQGGTYAELWKHQSGGFMEE